MARRRRGPFLTRGHGLRQPEVTRGEDKPIPEHRPEILAKIIAKLDSTGPFLQQYSNGEFVSNSLAVGRTYEACKGVRVLDAPGYAIHHDPVTGIFWRHGGSFD